MTDKCDIHIVEGTIIFSTASLSCKHCHSSWQIHLPQDEYYVLGPRLIQGDASGITMTGSASEEMKKVRK